MLFKFTISILLCLTMALGVSASAASTTVSAEADVGSAEIAHYLRIWRLAAPDIRGPLVRNFFTNHSISLDWWISDLEETRAAVVERTNALNDSITRNINDLTELNLKKLLPVLKKLKSEKIYILFLSFLIILMISGNFGILKCPFLLL